MFTLQLTSGSSSQWVVVDQDPPASDQDRMMFIEDVLGTFPDVDFILWQQLDGTWDGAHRSTAKVH